MVVNQQKNVIQHYFKNIYLYLAQNKLPSSKVAVRQVETQVERYLLLDSLLSRIQNLPDELKPVLCIPESCVDYILDLYANSHQGFLEVFLKIKQKFFVPN